MTYENAGLKDTLRVFVVPTEILDMEEIGIYEKMVYMVLRSYANGQDNTVFPSYNTIAKKASMSRPKAIECVKKLEELGLLVKEQRMKVSNNGEISQTSNLYYMYRPAEVRKQGVVNDVNHPSKHGLPPLVNDVNHPSKHGLPENNHLKEQGLKNNIKIDDDKRTSPSGEASAIPSDEEINSVIDTMKEDTKEHLSDRSFKSVVRKVLDKQKQGKIDTSFRDYLATALFKKIQELEARREKENAIQAIKADKPRGNSQNGNGSKRPVPFYNWLEQ